VLAGKQEQRCVEAQTPERTLAGMPKHKPPDAVSTEKKKQSHELILLYEKYKDPIHTYVYRLLRSQEDANDLTQEVFLRAFVSWKDLYDRDNLSAWLYRIATNLCVDLLRRRKQISWATLARQRATNPQLDGEVEEDTSYLSSNSGGIPEVLEREHIRLTLANMPEDYAIALVLSAAQGLSYQDIAIIVGVSPPAAATRISRAKRLFTEQYQRLNTENAQKWEE
jgi:RNA polymerase sigma-70 factor (ECF subfamily)